MAIIAKRTIMSLYSDANDIYSHQVRVVLAEKGVNVDIIPVKKSEIPEDLAAINPYKTLPTLVDRELVLYNAHIIMEYLDERFPHPPLLPVYPIARAESRKMMHRIENDWYSLMRKISNDNDDSARQLLLNSMVQLEPIFADKPYFLSEEFSLLDCILAPLLWRFSQLGINVPDSAKNINAYMHRVFSRESFQASLTDAEKQLQVA